MTVTAPVVLPDFTTFSVGATTYQGVWNASTNIPALASGVGVKGQYYVVSVAGTTNLDGHNSWSQYDAAIYNGVNWDIVQGGIVSGEVTTALGFTPLSPSLNLSELASPAVARVNLGIDKRRAVGDASITIAVGDRTVALNVALTAPRVWTLPAASSVSAGQTLYLFDEVGGISATNTLTVTRAGADTINGATTLVFANAYDGCPLMSDGISKWSQDITGLEGGGTGATTAAGALASLGAVNKAGDTLTGALVGADGSSWSSTGFNLAAGKTFGWTDGYFARDSAGNYGLRNGVNPQTFSLYATYTDAGNYERLKLGYAGGVYLIDTSGIGTGSNRALRISVAGQLYDFGGSFFNPANVNCSGYMLSSSPTAGSGYAAGAGGTVVQATSKATGVTLNKVCGTVTLNGAALASATSVAFVFTNSAIGANDFVEVQHDSVGTLGGYAIVVTPAAGSCTVTVRNNTVGSLSEALVLRFLVTKAVIA